LRMRPTNDPVLDFVVVVGDMELKKLEPATVLDITEWFSLESTKNLKTKQVGPGSI
jgi:hypothetical protein